MRLFFTVWTPYLRNGDRIFSVDDVPPIFCKPDWLPPDHNGEKYTGELENDEHAYWNQVHQDWAVFPRSVNENECAGLVMHFDLMLGSIKERPPPEIMVIKHDVLKIGRALILLIRPTAFIGFYPEPVFELPLDAVLLSLENVMFHEFTHTAKARRDCNPTEFIVQERRSNTPLSAITDGESNSSNTPTTAQRSQETTISDTHIPESTYEIFQRVFDVDQPSTSFDIHSNVASHDILTEETASLLRFYQNGIGVWMDIFDSPHTYQNEVVRYSLSSPLLMHAVCALAPKQMSLIQNKFLWEPASSRFYGESLSLLIKELTEQSTNRDFLLAASILPGSYELLAQPGIDYQRHLNGAHTLILCCNIGEQGSFFVQASFWIYARQDVALALANERPTLTPAAKWPAPCENSTLIEDYVGNKIVWLLERVIEAKFTLTNDDWTVNELGSFESLVSETDLY
ncbi:hypothetical protein NUU61_008186 [Penicillium alfredii]|uniref:Uncharacterized protein n=1 Tax=Penicillium alfredii TaxID=1506179 RepID=A0A9W9JYS3_9EURO|nr:uncharacterized protein NUU61_008186 [Penicillium alfredii]KAJ5086879.1 hypothetical protein NUU61_008186 [Penicillium alfredii]